MGTHRCTAGGSFRMSVGRRLRTAQSPPAPKSPLLCIDGMKDQDEANPCKDPR